jgi:hypothetical protein
VRRALRAVSPVDDVMRIANWYDNNPVVQAMTQVAYERGVAEGKKQGRKQAADALLAAVNEPEQFYTNPHVSILLVSQIFDVARTIAEGGEPRD